MEPESTEVGPVYRMMPGSRIAVSRLMGKVWQERKDRALEAREFVSTEWEKNIDLYLSASGESSKRSKPQLGTDTGEERENVVFSNIAAQVPILYSKNPVVSFNTMNASLRPLSEACQALFNVLAAMPYAPGLNLKYKIRKAIVIALCTNAAYAKVGWTTKEDSIDLVTDEIIQLSKELQNADANKIREIEGKLMALEQRSSILSPSGPTLKILLPNMLIVDPTSQEPDHSDANWMMEMDFLPNDYINAVYGEKDPETGEVKALYKPSHIITAPDTTEDVLSIRSGESDSKLQSAYGYSAAEQLRHMRYNKVWWIWDKISRRVFLYLDNDWNWPLWVWDDPLKLPAFFPYHRLWFVESPNAAVANGEVSYIRSQQASINEINSERSLARRWGRLNIFYNKNVISQSEVEAIIRGRGNSAVGIDVHEDADLNRLITAIVPPSVRFPELFDTNPLMQTISRITGLHHAAQGGEFRTNTNTAAVNFYSAFGEARLEEKEDLIQEFIARIALDVIILALQHWSKDEVRAYIGDKAQGWQSINEPKAFLNMFVPQVEADSTTKPNSSQRKREAIELGQVLGQFASAAPAVLLPMLELVRSAFPEANITDEMWSMIMDSLRAKMGGDARSEIEERVKNLSPQQKMALKELIDNGIPPEQALQEVGG